MSEPFLEEFLHKIDFCYLVEHNMKILNEQFINYHWKIIQIVQLSELNKKFGHYYQEIELHRNKLIDEICELKKLVMQLINKNDKLINGVNTDE